MSVSPNTHLNDRHIMDWLLEGSLPNIKLKQINYCRMDSKKLVVEDTMERDILHIIIESLLTTSP